ncbi:MAG: hypothetical protein ABSA79_12135 [Candidatus Bathyarchaeia archaeon]|jgi:hypothetical protein
MSDRSKGDPTTVSRLDRILSDYAEKCRLEDDIDTYLKDTIEPESDEFTCKFKDNCYTFKSKMGTCPCEFNE